MKINKVRAQRSQFSYTYLMINMKLLSVVTPSSIYHGCSTQKTLWEEKFTGKENLTLGEFTSVNMENCVCCNVMKHRDVNDSDKYITLDISLKFGILEKTRITSSDPKDNFGRSRKGLIDSLIIKAKVRPNKYRRQGMPS